MRRAIVLFSLAPLLAATPLMAQTPTESAPPAPMMKEGDALKILQSFFSADKDKDRKLSPQEFRQFIDQSAKQGVEAAAGVQKLNLYDYAFNMFDSNKDGFVAATELASVARQQAR